MGNDAPAQQQIVDQVWGYESLAVLAWSLSLLRELPMPTQVVDVPALAKVILGANNDTFVAGAAPDSGAPRRAGPPLSLALDNDGRAREKGPEPRRRRARSRDGAAPRAQLAHTRPGRRRHGHVNRRARSKTGTPLGHPFFASERIALRYPSSQASAGRRQRCSRSCASPSRPSPCRRSSG